MQTVVKLLHQEAAFALDAASIPAITSSSSGIGS